MILASLVGTSLEWYDFFLYGTASALVFNKLFFPNFDPVVGTLLAFATYAVGFVARPLGGIVFGHFGDRVGRKQVLVVTLLIMGIATFLIGLLPTYASIGVAAPILLVALRFVQGLGLGGEWGGAVLMSLEHGAPDRRGLNASWPQVGVPVGNLLAAGVLAVLNLVLSEQAFLSWGWRVAFLLSGVLVLVGLWIRMTIAESPLFAEVEETGAKAKLPLVEVLKQHPKELLIAMGARIGTDVAFYTFTLYILTFITHEPRAAARRRPQRGAHRLGLPARAHPVLRVAVGPHRPAPGLRRRRGERGAVGVRLLPDALDPLAVRDRDRHRRRARDARGDVRPAGGVHRGAVLHEAALQRGVDGLPDRRRARRRDRAAGLHLARGGDRHPVRRVLLRAGDGGADPGRAGRRAGDLADRPARRGPD